jgi:DNA polymerase-3 subunit alpha
MYDYSKPVTEFCHLHVHSSYSLLDGIGKPSENAKRAADIGQQSLAISDHGTCAGHYEFQTACDKYGVKPILGAEFYFVEDRNVKSLTDEEKEAMTTEERQAETRKRQANPHLILLAETDVGLKNIYHLNYLAAKEGFYGKPRIDLELLRKYNEGIIATTTCIISPWAKYYFRGETDKMKKLFEEMYDIFGKDRFFVELHPHEKFSYRDGNTDQHAQREYNFTMIELFRKNYDVRCTLANDAHYPEKKHSAVHKFMFAVNTNGKYDETSCNNLYIASEEDMRRFWHDNGHSTDISDVYLDEAIETTKEIATRCNARIDVDSLKEPQFEIPDGYETNKDYILKLLKDGLNEKIKTGQVNVDEADVYIERIQTELSLISDKGYVDYFLLTRDFCNWAYEEKILQSPGRGSAAGSLICWLLGITRVNPIKYNLFFERFMNPERIKEPDIDNDFQDSERQRVKDYVAVRWGADSIASCAAYSRYTANTLFREVCKQFGVEYSMVNKIAKTISGHTSLNKDVASFSDIMEKNNDIKDFIGSLPEEDAYKFVNIIDTVIGNVRNVTIAGGGTIISSQPLHEMMPLRASKDEGIITEWQVDELTKMKFLKIDILGISTLSIIKNIMDQVGMTIDDLYDMPVDREELSEDEQAHYDRAYQLLQEGETQGIFQFGGSNITRCLQKMIPTTLEHIAAVNAIYRPGVIKSGAMEAFLRRRNGEEESVNDYHTLFDEILAPTENIMIYQEQFIQMFNKLGLDFGKSDILRRIAETGDKDACYKYMDDNLYCYPDIMALSKKETHGIASKVIEAAGYLFNKSHAISYSQLAYWTAYMKAKFPDKFVEVMFNHHHGDQDNQAINLNMAKKLLDKPTVSLGDINTFTKDYKVVGDTITIGVKSVNGIGDSVIKKIENNRPIGGWLTFDEFIEDNVYKKMISYKNLQILVRLGMFDSIPVNGGSVELTRKALCDVVEILGKVTVLTKKKLNVFLERTFGAEVTDKNLLAILSAKNLVTLLDEFGITPEEEYTEDELIQYEIGYLGYRLGEDTEKNDMLKQMVSSMGIGHITDIPDEDGEHPHHWTIIQSIEKLKTKNGKPYANVRVDDGSSFRVWWNKLQYIDNDLVPGRLVVVKLNSDTFGRSLAHGRSTFMNDKEIINLYDEVSE